MSPAIIIPAYQPTECLLQLVDNISSELDNNIIIINDGSSPEHQDIFNKLKHHKNIDILDHYTNQGKGAALKTAFKYFLENSKYERNPGVITADADGQHLSKI